MKISIATEDILTEEVMVKILSSVSDVDIPFKLGKQGCGYLKKNIHKFNELSYLIFIMSLLFSIQTYKLILTNSVHQ